MQGCVDLFHQRTSTEKGRFIMRGLRMCEDDATGLGRFGLGFRV